MPMKSATATSHTASILLDCVTWNVHRTRGNDGETLPERTTGVLLDEVARPAPEVLVLTEADDERPPHAGLLDLGRVGEEAGLQSVHEGPARRWGAESHGFLGVVVLVAPWLGVEDVVLLDLPGHCHRGAVVADVEKRGQLFRLIATHLSLGQPARIAQMRVIGQHLSRRAPRPTVLCGDLNEWRPWGGLALSPRVTGLRLSGPVRATFPTRWPFLPLDRVLAGGGATVQEVQVLDGPGIRAASDHRPLAARVRLNCGQTPPSRVGVQR